MKNRWGNQRGMTLIEIMVVIAIIGIIGTISVGYILDRFEDAKVDGAKAQIVAFGNLLDQFRRDAGFYPSSEQGLQALIEKPSIGRTPKHYAVRGYTKNVPKDPWGCDYLYYSPGLQGHDYEIYTYGADCQEGGDGYDADVASFEIGE